VLDLSFPVQTGNASLFPEYIPEKLTTHLSAPLKQPIKTTAHTTDFMFYSSPLHHEDGGGKILRNVYILP